MVFDQWLAHFQENASRHRELEAAVDGNASAAIDGPTRRALVRSFQRFELGESGDGERLLAKAIAAGDPTYLAALRLLVLEEQKHAVLFRRALDHLHAPTLRSHWSNAAFVALRRMLGLRTELALFLIAESGAMDYFVALSDHAPDPVLRAIGRRIATDERDHIRFQIDRLRIGFRGMLAAARAVVGLGWSVIAAGTAAVVVLDHGPALRACGLSPVNYWWQAVRQFHRVALSVLGAPEAAPLGPITVVGNNEHFIGAVLVEKPNR